MEPKLIMRKAQISDVKSIHALLMEWSLKEMLLPRSLSQLYTHLREFFVLCAVREKEGGVQEERIVGCCALTIFWEDLAEIRSLAVAEDQCRKGYGRMLMDAVTAEAMELGLKRLFALTYQVEFFARMGFSQVSKDVLPQKIWADCINCPRFPDCNEVAVLREIE